RVQVVPAHRGVSISKTQAAVANAARRLENNTTVNVCGICTPPSNGHAASTLRSQAFRQRSSNAIGSGSVGSARARVASAARTRRPAHPKGELGQRRADGLSWTNNIENDSQQWGKSLSALQQTASNRNLR